MTDEDRPKEYWHALLPLSPTKSEHQGIGETLAHIEVQLREGGKAHLCLLGHHGHVNSIAVAHRSDLDPEISRRAVSKLFEHAFAVLSLTYSNQIDVIHTAEGYVTMGYYSETEIPGEVGVQIRPPDFAPNEQFSPQNVMNVLAESSAHRAALCALSESQRPSTPRHYRFLSLVRALELMVPLQNDRDDWLDRYQLQFAATGVSGMLFRNYVPRLRNRCAHGVGRGTEDPIVSIGLEHGEPVAATFKVLEKATFDKMFDLTTLRGNPPHVSDSAAEAAAS